ncbi:MAG: hypothetical protein H7829_08560 [Magnetococcus sp. THC-1_WYH]
MPKDKVRKTEIAAPVRIEQREDTLEDDEILIVDIDPPGPFAAYTVHKFQTWLRVGFEEFLFEGKDIWAFPGAENFLAGGKHFIRGLGEFYRTLPASPQAHFRQAIADLLATLPSEKRAIPVFEYLLDLAVETQAYEILQANILRARVGAGFFGLTDDMDEESLFAQTLMTVAQLAAPIHDALETIRTLIHSPHFDHAYSGVTLTTLCHCDGSQLLQHLAQLRKPLAQMFREFSSDAETKRELVESVLETVGPDQLVSVLTHLTHFDHEKQDAPHDTWFLDGLLLGNSPLMSIRRTEDDWFALTRINSTVSYPLPSDGSTVHELIDYLRENGLDRVEGPANDEICRKIGGIRDENMPLFEAIFAVPVYGEARA